MADGVLLDTSFLITLANAERPNHATARRYFDFFVEEGVLMYLSTIVASEFHVKQPVQHLPLRSFSVLPFSLSAAMAAAELDRLREGEVTADRVALKDDLKILGQARELAVAFLITEDEKSLFKWCEAFRAKGAIPTRGLKLSDGFDRSHFDPARQHRMEFGSGPSTPGSAPTGES